MPPFGRGSEEQEQQQNSAQSRTTQTHSNTDGGFTAELSGHNYTHICAMECYMEKPITLMRYEHYKQRAPVSLNSRTASITDYIEIWVRVKNRSFEDPCPIIVSRNSSVHSAKSKIVEAGLCAPNLHAKHMKLYLDDNQDSLFPADKWSRVLEGKKKPYIVFMADDSCGTTPLSNSVAVATLPAFLSTPT
eukprot:TRINITY_DN3781_c1_g1_i3.p1 TRINITY_DN3781_c1_g1~~TRINITY_DN3781_c1_g1_i3.p1  ORF type:complete len:190 (-),score=15.37 TRINITY_DN3781_c1_g1_i3:310-879(-)